MNKLFDTVFNESGNFILQHYDPHYHNVQDEEQVAFHRVLFDQGGNLNPEFDEQSLFEFIISKEHTVSPFSDCVRLYYAVKNSNAVDDQFSVASMYK